MYKLIALIGESGSGKDTVLNLIAEKYPDFFHVPINCTTRPKRKYEIGDKDYHFLSHEDFTRCFLEGDFIQVTEFNSWFYGTIKSDLSEDKINIVVLNPGGVEQIQYDQDVEMVVFYISCPGRLRLIRQLQREEDPDIPEIFRRYFADDEDFFDLPFPHAELKNEVQEDLETNIKIIVDFARDWTKRDK